MEIYNLYEVIKTCKAPSEIRNFKPPNEVVFFTKGKTVRRNIFSFQKFNAREIEKIKRLRLEIKHNNFTLPPYWGDSELLKHVYGSNFKTKKAFSAIKSCIKSRSEYIDKNLFSVDKNIIRVLVCFK